VKIKRFVDTDMRRVLRRVRDEQGPDAVILSNRRVAEGIEVVAAVDYDEALMQYALGSAPTEGESAAVASTSADAKAERPDGTGANADDRPAGTAGRTARHAESGDVRVLAARLESTPAGSTSDPRATAASRPGEDDAIRTLQCEVSNMRGVLETQLSELLWKESMRKAPARAQILRNLTKIGIGPDIANVIADRLDPVTEPKAMWRAPLLELAKLVPLRDDDLLVNGGVAALVGPTGVGKTTTVAKLAFRYAIANGTKDIALVAADAHRIGAREHLATFAKLLGVTVYPAEDIDALERLLDTLGDKKLVLIDTEGTSQRDVDLSARLAAYGRNEDRVRFYLALAATTQEAGLDETIRVFKRLPLAGAIVTKIDEAAQLGCVLGSLIRHDLPAAYLSDGQRIPDDLHAAARKRLWLVNQAVESLRSVDVRVTEDMMVERFASAGVAHA